MELFDKQKQANLKKYKFAKARAQVDKDIIPFCDFINSLENFYTSSSCAGRIVILKSTGKKKPQSFIKKWHHEVSFEEAKDVFEKYLLLENINKHQDHIWLKQEGAIFHIVSRSLKDAEKIVVLARNLGWKRTGIQVIKKNRIILEIISTERMDVPLINKGKKLVKNWEEYLIYLVDLANKKHIKARKQMTQLEKKIRNNLKN